MSTNINRNIIYNFLKTFSQIIFPLITFPYISRTLLAENVGKINFGSSIITYFSLIANLGMYTYAIRECAKARENKTDLSKVASQLFSINLVMTIISYIGLCILLYFSDSLYNYRFLLAIQSLTIICNTLGTDWINSAMEDFKYITIRSVAFQFTSLLLMFVFVRQPEDYMKYVYISVFSASATSILNIFYRKKFCDISFTFNFYLKKHIKPIIWIFALILSQTIFVSSDQTILGLFCGDIEVGVYSVAVKIYSIVNQVIASIAFVVMPQMSNLFVKNNYHEINKLYKYSSDFITLLGLPCLFGLYFLSDELVLLIGGPEYIFAGNALKILTIALGFSFFSGLIGNIILLPSGKDKYMFFACIIAAIVNLITNIIFIPNYGMVAAAWTTVVAQAITLVINYLYADKNVKLLCFFENMPEAILGCLGMTVAIMLIKYFCKNILLCVSLSASLGAVVYFIIMIARKNEFVLNYVQSFLRKVKK